MKNIPSLLTKLTLRLWPVFLVGTLVLSGISLPRTIHLFKNISTDPIDLLPAHSPNVHSIVQVREKLERGANTAIVFESENPTKTLAFLKDTVAQLRNHPLVGDVIDKKVGFDFFNRNKLMYVDLKDLISIRDEIGRWIQRKKLGPLYIDFEDLQGEGEEFFKTLEERYKDRYSGDDWSEYNVSRDGKIFSIQVGSKLEDNGLSEASQFHDAMDQFVNNLRPAAYEPTLKVYFAGSGKVMEYRALMKDLTRVGIISGILLFIPLLLRFRNPIHLALIFTPLLLAMPIGFAAASFFVPKLNVSTSFLFAILGGLGVENGIHIFSRYFEVRKKRGALPQALHDIFAHTGRSILTSVASVVVTFLLLMINDFRGFYDFGLIAGIGLWIIFLIYFSFLPSLLILFEKIRLLKISPLPEKDSSQISASAPSRFKLSSAWMKPSLVFFTLFTLFSFGGAFFLKFEFDSKKIRADIPEVRLIHEKQHSTIRRVNNPAVIVIHSQKEAQALTEAVEEKIQTDKETPTIDTARSYYDLVPPDQDRKIKVTSQILKLLSDPIAKLVKGEQKEKLDRLKETLVQAKKVSAEEIPSEVMNIFNGKSEVPGKLFYINALPHLELDDGINAIHFAEDVAVLKTKMGTYYPASDALIFGLILKTMLRDSKKVLLISLLSVAFFVFLDFRNWKKAGVVLVSIILGVLWLLGVMFLFKIKFNFYNIIIIPAVMGMSIDNSIHIYHRYEELGCGSLQKVLSSTGMAAMLASLTNASGFFGLLFCAHRGLYSIGLLAVIGVVTCLVSTLVFLPVLLQFLERIQYNGKPLIR